MKLYITIFLLCLALLCQAQSDTPITKEVLANTSFNGRHCRGDRGICSSAIETKSTAANSHFVYNGGTSLELFIKRSKLSNDETKKITGYSQTELEDQTNLYYTIDDKFILPLALKEALDISHEKKIIKKGNYLINTTEENFIITFNIE